MEKEEINKIEIRSEEVQEILGRPPRWVIRWGITVIFIVIAVIFIGSYFFKYPDVINSTIIVNTENLPANVVAKTNGKIVALFIKDKQKVKKDNILAIIENPANFDDVVRLKIKLDSVNIKSILLKDSMKTIQFNESYILGDLQTSYIGFLKGLKDYQIFIESDFQHKKINSLKNQISKYNTLLSRLSKQSNIMDKQLDIAKQQHSRDSALYKNSTISKIDFEKSENALLQSKYSYESAKSSLDNTRITISQIEQNILELQQQYDEQKQQLELALNNNYEALKNQIKTWEQTYLLKSPIDGKVTFTQYWSVNQNVKAGDNVITIVPEKEAKIIGKIKLPIQGSGKVKVGQKVNIKFANYPYMEYGMVKGIIKSISLVPMDANYTVEVELPEGLKTNYNKTLIFSQEMQGSAEIITDDIRLIERFLNPLKAVWKKNI
ncbi:MAG: HlyD family efflux transporter periplasmic adaptor subunit [Bacteroidales bacterium]|nr:HlyD family efflux transporter periplasmic adaptor subunit [Bacteroidales bacterium]